jgi:DNA replication protein DnaC
LPLCLIGDSGTGKSDLLIALGTEAAMAGHRVRYVLATKLVNELVEAADEKTGEPINGVKSHEPLMSMVAGRANRCSDVGDDFLGL